MNSQKGRQRTMPNINDVHLRVCKLFQSWQISDRHLQHNDTYIQSQSKALTQYNDLHVIAIRLRLDFTSSSTSPNQSPK